MNVSKKGKDTPMGNRAKEKRDHLSLATAQKVESLQTLHCGASVRLLTEEQSVGTTTVYDLEKQKDMFLKFYGDSDDQKLMKNRKTLHKTKNKNPDHVLSK
jgi:hypothetical protein